MATAKREPKAERNLDGYGAPLIPWTKVRERLKQGYVSLKGNYLIYPAIQASPTGTAAMIMTLSGKNFFPSVVYTVLQAGQPTFGPLHVAAFGTGPYFHKSTRWGDYSWATLDPNGNSFWMATEYIPPLSSQTTDGKQNWGTRVIEASASA